MDADVHDPPGQSAQQANERKGLRALLGKVVQDSGATEGSSGQTGPTGQTRQQAPVAAGTQSGTAPAADATARAGTPSTGTDGHGTEANGTETESGTGAPARALRKGPRLLGGAGQSAGTEPSRRQQRTSHLSNRALASSLNSRPLTSRPLINPHLRHDPRLRVWIVRAVVSVAILIGVTIGLNWRIGLTAMIIYIAADTVLRSRTTSVVPAGVRVTSAQRFTRRRLRVLQPAGYMALHARAIPGTKHVIDHVVVGPAGVFTLDSERLDRRLPLRAIGGMLYHGRQSMEGRFDHAQHEAGHAATLIAAELGQRVRVRPVMVLYGPSISWVIMRVKGVDAFDGSRVGTYFRRQSKAVGKSRLNAGQIAMVLAAAARALPPLQ